MNTNNSVSKLSAFDGHQAICNPRLRLPTERTMLGQPRSLTDAFSGSNLPLLPASFEIDAALQ
jgi:hypothetical protein